jgi:hypothetical protein
VHGLRASPTLLAEHSIKSLFRNKLTRDLSYNIT